MLDEVAMLTAGAVPEFEIVCSRYKTDQRLFMNGTLLSYVNGDIVEVSMT